MTHFTKVCVAATAVVADVCGEIPYTRQRLQYGQGQIQGEVDYLNNLFAYSYCRNCYDNWIEQSSFDAVEAIPPTSHLKSLIDILSLVKKECTRSLLYIYI